MLHSSGSSVRFFWGILCLCISCELCHVQAGLIINLKEVEGNVVATGFGDLNTTDLTLVPDFYFNQAPMISAISAVIMIGSNDLPYFWSSYTGISGPSNFGFGGLAAATSVSGDSFFLETYDVFGGPRLGVSPSYVSGSTLAGQAIWENQTLTSLGVTPGTYVWFWGFGPTSDFVELNAITAVPEPSSFLCLFVTVALSVWRRKRFSSNPKLENK